MAVILLFLEKGRELKLCYLKPLYCPRKKSLVKYMARPSFFCMYGISIFITSTLHSYGWYVNFALLAVHYIPKSEIPSLHLV